MNRFVTRATFILWPNNSHGVLSVPSKTSGYTIICLDILPRMILKGL